MIRKGIHPSAVIDVAGELTIPDTTVVEPGCVFYGGPEGRIVLGARNIFYPNCTIRVEHGWIRTGDDVSFGPGCGIYEPRAGLEIGNACLIASGVMICGVEHGFAATDRPIRFQPMTNRKIVIEDDVWLGMGVIVLPGVTIGHGSIVGAGAVVSRSLKPFSIARGMPARSYARRQPRAGSPKSPSNSAYLVRWEGRAPAPLPPHESIGVLDDLSKGPGVTKS